VPRYSTLRRWRVAHPTRSLEPIPVGSILGAPVAAMIFEQTASWIPVFALVIGMDILTGLLALFVLKPMRSRRLSPAAA
jgi:hypothetical protein